MMPLNAPPIYAYEWVQLEDLVKALPPQLRAAAIEISERLALPIDLVVINMISALCSVFQGTYDYQNMEGRARPISENVIIVGPKASGKSRADRAIFDGLRELDKQLAKSQSDVGGERAFQGRLWRDQEAVLRSRYRALLMQGLPSADHVENLRRHEEEKPKKIFTSQLFFEKLTIAGTEDLISRPGIAFTFASDEGIKIAKSGPLKDPGVMSQAWDGTAQSKVTMNGSYRADNYRVSTRIDLQSEVFEKIFLNLASDLTIVGFQQRCLYYNFVPNTADDSRSPNAVIGPMEKRFLEGLIYAAKQYAYGSAIERMPLRFADKTKGAWSYINEQLRETSYWNGPLVRMPAFQRRLMEHAERVACALHLGEQMFESTETICEVDAGTLKGASIVAKYYAQHACHLYFPATQTQQERDAIKLQAKLDGIFARGVPFVFRNEILNSDIVPGKNRFDEAMDFIEKSGRYRTLRTYRQGSHKQTQIIVINSQQAIDFALAIVLPPSNVIGPKSAG